MGELDLARGDFERAGERYAELLDQIRARGDQMGEAYARWGLGMASSGVGRYAEAEEHLTAGVRLAERTGDWMILGRLLLTLGQTRLASTQSAAAAAAVARALTLFERMGAPLWQARGMEVLGALYASTGDTANARAAWRDGLALLDGVASVDRGGLVATLTARLSGSDPVRSDPIAVR
jgi:tetratricopeptide (TPR) repeat protein